MLSSLAVALCSLALQAGPTGAGAAPPETKEQEHEHLGPGPEPVDLWHPARATPVQPAYGGTVTVHIEALPPSLNCALLNSTYARSMLHELHATLLRRDWEQWSFVPELAEDFELDDGGKGITFRLRAGVTWHDGHPFDVEDVLFSWRIARNPAVRCDWVRGYLTKIVAAEVLDARRVRFTFAEPYFNARALFVDNFCILPRHLYDLRDPAHPRHDPAASDEACAKEINENVHNTQWVGLGPYRLTRYSPQGVEAERYDGFFEPAQGGYLDRIVWRYIASDEASFQALLNGELDFSMRISSEQYFGAATDQAAFTRRFTKGYFYLGAFNYVPWNMRRPQLADLRVRKALAHAMDLEAYVQNVAHGLAKLPTGPQCYFGPSYEHGVQRLAYDPARAEELLAEAGWYDRDGDGVVDKDGRALEIEILIQGGNVSAEGFARLFQESLGRVGVRLEITPLDSATYFERIRVRDFDAGMAGWSVDVTENDPAQLWHSRSAEPGGSNHAGVIDAKVDAWIERGQRELDDERRWALWRELHRYLYEEVQPYFYREAPPRKFALALGLRGVQFFKITPGYALRRWYYPAGTLGTRATVER
jgi:peptide/nickel transport system substrate-binding protein